MGGAVRTPGVHGGGTVMLVPLAFGYGFLFWRFSRYRVEGGQLRVEHGIVFRRVPTPAPAAVPVRETTDPWAPPASTDAKHPWGPLTEGLNVLGTWTSATARRRWNSSA